MKRNLTNEEESALPRAGLWSRMRTRFAEVAGSACRAEISGARQVVLQGCRRIVTYTEDCICLTVADAHARTVTVRGRGLSCLSYHADAVVVEGEIAAVLFSAEAREGESAL